MKTCPSDSDIEGGTQKNQNYLLEVRPLVVQAPPLGEYSWNPSVSLYQLVVLQEAAFGFSEFFENSFSAFTHFMMADLKHTCQ